jgi:hypothetical protein
MPRVRPELIFVAGPQKHERAVLMNNEVVAGRSAQADLLIREAYVSRQQMKFTFTRDGWTVENLSDRRIVISGKSYKAGKQILLASGDVIACGQETEMLFVDANDDPGEVLGAYRKQHPDAPRPVSVPPAAVGAGDDEGPATAPVPREPEPEIFTFEPEQRERRVATEEEAASPEQREAKKRRNRTRLYLIGFGVYAVLMLVVIIVLVRMKGNAGPVGPIEAPAMLSEREVKDALASPLKKSPNAEASQQALERARQHYVQRTVREENRYLAVKNYRLYLAFRRPAERIFLPRDEPNYDNAIQELAARIMNHYRSAYALAQARQWSRALSELNNVLDYFPSDEVNDDPEVKQTIIQNVRDHAAYVSNQMGSEKDKPRRR